MEQYRDAAAGVLLFVSMKKGVLSMALVLWA
jgi:hypothetical protein